MCVCVHVCAYVYVHVCAYVYVHVYVCMWVCLCAFSTYNLNNKLYINAKLRLYC